MNEDQAKNVLAMRAIVRDEVERAVHDRLDRRSPGAAAVIGMLKSRTNWLFAAVGTAIASYDQWWPGFQAQILPLLPEALQAEVIRLGGLAVVLVGMYVRYTTRQSVEEKGAKKEM